jgi:hypothetical protein
MLDVEAKGGGKMRGTKSHQRRCWCQLRTREVDD